MSDQGHGQDFRNTEVISPSMHTPKNYYINDDHILFS